MAANSRAPRRGAEGLRMTVEQYLAFEAISREKREYDIGHENLLS